MLQRTVSGCLSALVLTLTLALAAGTGSASASDAAGPQDWVRHSQQRLNELGCDSGPADGIVGNRTRAAVTRFQSRHRLRQTGRFTTQTRQALGAAKARRCDTRPVPGHTGKGRRVVISQRQNWVWLVGAGGRVVGQSGMVDNPSVLHRGTTRVGSYCGRTARIRRNSDGGGLWLQNFVRFAPCGIGFHRIPTSKATGAQIHPDWLVGTDARSSHGCIRLPLRFSRQVWHFATLGTRVTVVRG